jgi:hypothetical protein
MVLAATELVVGVVLPEYPQEGLCEFRPEGLS